MFQKGATISTFFFLALEIIKGKKRETEPGDESSQEKVEEEEEEEGGCEGKLACDTCPNGHTCFKSLQREAGREAKREAKGRES